VQMGTLIELPAQHLIDAEASHRGQSPALDALDPPVDRLPIEVCRSSSSGTCEACPNDRAHVGKVEKCLLWRCHRTALSFLPSAEESGRQMMD